MTAPALHTELHALALAVAEEGARMAREMREAGVAIADRKTSVADIVTEADRAVEQLIRDRIAEARPQDGFLGEETDQAGSASGLTWVVDPIDGTVNYAYGIPAWAVSIAVVEGDPRPEIVRALQFLKQPVADDWRDLSLAALLKNAVAEWTLANPAFSNGSL